MIKYLKCESKARAMGISRETYVSFVESMGYNYSLDTHNVDAYGFIEREVEGIKEYALVVDTEATYYIGLPQVHKDRLVTEEDMIIDGWVFDIPVEE